jgi:soluble lytic murein transglycosylase-like protein
MTHSLARIALAAAGAATLCCGVDTAHSNPHAFAREGSSPSQTALARLANYDHYIDYFASQRYGEKGNQISPAYIRALIVAESAANHYAISPKGARGLTQIMPQTGRMAAVDLLQSGVDYEYIDERKLVKLSAEALHDPAINLLIACYLSSTYGEWYGGRTDLIASAWNAGPEAVARYGNRPPPYAETRGLLIRIHDYLTYFQEGRQPAWKLDGSQPAWSFSRWDTTGFNTPGWDLDYDAPGWDIGWKPPKQRPPKF